MVSQVPARIRRKPKRRLPPGQKLFLLLAIAGVCCFLTVSIFRPWVDDAHSANPADQSTGSSTQAQDALLTPMPTPFPLTQPLGELINTVRLHANQPNLKAGVFAVEPDTGRFIDIDSRRAYASASMIKLPILVKLLQAVDQGQVKLDQKLTIRKELIGGGSGWLQWRKPGTQISLDETAELMMIISDNTATNMIIDLLGGKDVFNQDFAKWGLADTRINNWLPDLAGTNTSSPYDLAVILARVDKGELLTPASRAWLLHALERNHIRTLLPRGLPAGTKIADKTGDIARLVGDAGIITTKDGKRYIVAVAVERPWNDRRANALVRRISKDVYIGITGDVEGAKTVVVDDEQKPVPKAKCSPRTRKHRRRHR